MRTLISLFGIYFLSLFAFQHEIVAQTSDQEADKGKIRIKVQKSVNGEETTIDEIIDLNDPNFQEAIEGLHKYLGENEEMLKSLENLDLDIDISIDGDFEEHIEQIVEKKLEHFEPNFVEVEPRPFLGVNLSENETGRVVVDNVVSGSAAEKAGLQSGDLILAINNDKINSTSDLIGQIQTHEIGDEIEVMIDRGGENLNKTAVLGERKLNYSKSCQPPKCVKPEPQNIKTEKRAFLGVVTEQGADGTGAVITKVVEESAADKAGLQEGDLILKINGVEVNDHAEVSKVLARAEPNSDAVINIDRNGKSKKIKTTLGEREFKTCAKVVTKSSCSGDAKRELFHHGKGENVDVEVEVTDDGTKIIKKYFHGAPDCIKSAESSSKTEVIEEEMIESGESEEGERNLFTKRVRVNVKVQKLNAEDKATLEGKVDPAVMNEVNELEVDGFKFYPNPTDGKFSFEIDLPEQGDTEITLYDTQGKEVYRESLADFSGKFSKKLDISESGKGTYLLVVTQNEKGISRKVVVQ